MRFDTHRARAFLVGQLMVTPGIADIHDDGTDIVVIQNLAGERIMIHFVERLMPLIELRALFRENSDVGIHTLPLFWADLLLPAHGQWYKPDDWMQALLNLQKDRIFAYEVFGDHVYMFVVHFHGRGWIREIEHGLPLDFRKLQTQKVHCDWPPMLGSWLVTHMSDATTKRWRSHKMAQVSPHLYSDFESLNLSPDADYAQVQRAYFQLAQKNHPDNNSAADANERMTELNLAYTRIRKQFMDDASA